MSNRRARGQQGRTRQSRPQQPMEHRLNLVEYLDELTEVRGEAEQDLAAAGERALKVLDGFLSDLAHALGMDDSRASMGDSIRHLEGLHGTPREIAGQAERYRDTRNALFHNPDIMLRPEAAQRIIDGVEAIVRMAAEGARDMARSRVVTADANEPVADARDRMLDHGYKQLIVVDERGGVIDLLTERDIVVLEAEENIDGSDLTVGEAIGRRGYMAAALLPTGSAAQEAVNALRDEQVKAVVLTEHGKPGQRPLGIITRGDVLKAL
jgi:predicted transcriptional regulator